MTKKPKKRFKLLTFTMIIFVLSILIFGTGTILLKAMDNSIVEEKQKLQAQINNLELINEKIINDIKLIDTENKLNIEELLAETKLSNNPDNIVEIDTNE